MRSEDSKPPESYEKIDLDGMSRKERRRLLSRIRTEKPEKRHLRLRRSDKIEAACEKLIGQVRDLSGETISRGLAVRLIAFPISLREGIIYLQQLRYGSTASSDFQAM